MESGRGKSSDSHDAHSNARDTLGVAGIFWKLAYDSSDFALDKLHFSFVGCFLFLWARLIVGSR